MRTDMIRTRWAAIGAAVAVCLGAGGIGLVKAETSSGPMPIYISINPCRLADTRPAPDNVGARITPVGQDETWTLTGWGAAGNCTLPSGTSALALNVTALGATSPTFVQLFPGDGTRPVQGSNLNPGPGQPPTPNAVIVDLSDSDGTFKLYNAFGSVQIIVDVVGYYDDHVHTGADIVDGSLTGADIQDGSVSGADIQDNSVSNTDTSNEPGVASGFSADLVPLTITAAATHSTLIRVPSNGYVQIEVTGVWYNGTSGSSDRAYCQLQKGAVVAIDFAQPWFELNDRNAGIAGYDLFSAHRIVPIAVADNGPIFGGGQAINLVCRELSGDNVFLNDVHISATFFATSYQSSPPVIGS